MLKHKQCSKYKNMDKWNIFRPSKTCVSFKMKCMNEVRLTQTQEANVKLSHQLLSSSSLTLENKRNESPLFLPPPAGFIDVTPTQTMGIIESINKWRPCQTYQFAVDSCLTLLHLNDYTIRVSGIFVFVPKWRLAHLRASNTLNAWSLT